MPPQDCSTAVLRADQERRTAVTPAWKEMYGLTLLLLLLLVVLVDVSIFMIRKSQSAKRKDDVWDNKGWCRGAWRRAGLPRDLKFGGNFFLIEVEGNPSLLCETGTPAAHYFGGFHVDTFALDDTRP